MTPSSIILSPVTALYGTIARTRLALYRRGYFKSAKLAVPIISVGNITVGGTGKTPLVEYLARTVAATGRKVCILTRGYGRENPGNRVVVSDGINVQADYRHAGDEPLLLAENLRGIAAVISDADRFAAGIWAIKNLGCEVFILDDGFQHLQLARNLNLVTVDATDPWGNGRLLPYGRLREPSRGLARADCILITRANQARNIDQLKREIEELSDNRPVLVSRMLVRGIRPLSVQAIGSRKTAAQIDTPVAAFSAIGNQDAFLRQLEAEGLTIAGVSSFPDHHFYTQRDIDQIIAAARQSGAVGLITTAKDAVKLSNLSLSLPCHVLDIEIQIDDEPRFLQLINEAIG